KKIIIILSILLLLLLGITIYYFSFNSNNNKITTTTTKPSIFITKGYSTKEVNEILKLSNTSQDLIESKEYLSYLYDLITYKYYIDSRLERYLNNYKDDIKTVVEKVNTNRDYEYFTNKKEADLTKDELVLVNKYYYLTSNYAPNDLIKVKRGIGSIRKEAYDAYIIMYNAAKEDNINLYVLSSYRSYYSQRSIYNNYVKQRGVERTDRSSARPGHSEHQAGFTLDFVVSGHSLGEFINSKEYRWLNTNSYKYGFILRYPKDKEGITGYMYEPWHYRYVGLDVAKYIHENNITFDEYYAYFIEN
ncbi:MAG TPA: M15 family metallopeptidase, partial [Bacilli bacterium]|nr:M15 family metallopeptidase [Bacilli bacterium]